MLVDSPPILPVTDALVLFRHVDAAIMVFTARKTTRRQAATALEMAHQVNAPLVGAVLNGAPLERGYGYAYQYSSGPPQGAETPADDAKTSNGTRRSRAKART